MKANSTTFDVAVIGAGVFGSWTALRLAQAGRRVVLLDQYGPANARASSGGESRIIRAGYGPDELYARWAMRSLTLWKELFAAAGVDLFHPCGVLWLAPADDAHAQQTPATLAKLGIAAERLDYDQLRGCYPQFNFEGIDWGLLEPHEGVLMARRAVQAVAAAAVAAGTTYLQALVTPLVGKGKLLEIQTSGGDRIAAGEYHFCLRSLVGKIVSRRIGGTNFPHSSGSFLLWRPSGQRALCRAGHAGMVDTE